MLLIFVYFYLLILAWSTCSLRNLARLICLRNAVVASTLFYSPSFTPLPFSEAMSEHIPDASTDAISMDAQNSHLGTSSADILPVFLNAGPPPPRPAKSKNRISFIETEPEIRPGSDGGDNTSGVATPTTLVASQSLDVNPRSKLRSVFLVLSCAGAMIINVGQGREATINMR